METQDTQQLFFDQGTVWVISTSGWSGKDRLRASDIGKEDADILDIIELGRKKILPEEVRIKLLRPRSQVTGLMNRLARPFFIRGAYYVANKNFLLIKNGLEAIRENQAVIVQDLIDNMPNIRDEMIERYPILADAVWPTDKQIRNRFDITWHVCEVTGTSAKETDPEELWAAKLEFQANLKDAYEGYKNEILRETQQAIIDACQDISEKISTGVSITETSLKKPRKVVEDYLNVAEVFDLNEVRVEVAKLQAELDGANAAMLRNNWHVAKKFAETMKVMSGNIGDLTGLSKNGMAKRVVKKAA